MRTEERKDTIGEVFTPIELCNQVLDCFPENIWSTEETWLEPACGHGNFLAQLLERLLPYHTKQTVLSKLIFGADLMEDNCIECIRRLYGDGEIEVLTKDHKDFPEEYNERGLIAVFTHDGKLVKNIVQADGLEYQYNFGRPPEVPDHMKGLFALKKRIGLF